MSHDSDVTGEIKVVVFDLGDRVFAIRIDYVREILEHRDPTVVPDEPSWLAGILELSEAVLPVVSLHRRFGAEERDTRRHLIHLTTPEGDMIFTADDVTAIRMVTPDQIKSVDKFGEQEGAHFLEGAVSLDGDLVLIIDPRRVVDMKVLQEAQDKAPIGEGVE